MNTPTTTPPAECGWVQRLALVTEVEGAAFQFGLLGSPTHILNTIANGCVERATTLREELSSTTSH